MSDTANWMMIASLPISALGAWCVGQSIYRDEAPRWLIAITMGLVALDAFLDSFFRIAKWIAP